MRIRAKSKNKTIKQEELYFSGEQDDPSQKTISAGTKRQGQGAKTQKTQAKKTQPIKKQPQPNPRCPSSSCHEPVNNSMQIKLQSSYIPFIQKIVEQKHGKILTYQKMASLNKKMVRQTNNQPNPYNQLKYNTGEVNEWRDKKKKTVSAEEKQKIKRHFLNMMRMVDRGEQTKFTLRDLQREFNLDDFAYLQIKRQFQMDPEVAYHLRKFSLKTDPQKQSSQIQHIVKKRQILQKMLHKNPLLTKAQLSEKIARYTKSDSFFLKDQIEKLLQSEGFNWRPVIKYPESRNFKENLDRRKLFCEKINYILTETKYSVYFLGIMNFNSFMFRTEGWTKDQYLIQPFIDESFTLVALTERSGQGTWKFQKQVYKQEIFGETCKTLFEQLISQSFEAKYIAVDFHLYKYKDVLRKSRNKYDIQIIWIPPFSNLLNPLEFWFEDIKNSLFKSKKMLQLTQECNLAQRKSEVLIKDIYNDLKDIFTQKYDSNFDFVDFFEIAAKYHRKALQGEKF